YIILYTVDVILVDSERIANEELHEALQSLCHDLDVDEVVGTFMGRTVPQCVEIIGTMLGRPPPPGFFDTWRQQLYRRFEERPVRTVAGVEAVLEGLDVPTSVVSNGPMLKIRTTLGVTGLLARFEGRIFSPDSGIAGKPQPDLFLAAAAAAGADPARTAVIEDTATGVRGARTAGMAVFGYVGGRYADAAALAGEGAKLF